MSSSKDEYSWSNIAFRLVVTTVSHPIEYAKVLIQIGHEPIAPYPTRTLFGKPALALPNVFQYVSYIKSVDGLSGCYRGLTPKILANVASGITCSKVCSILQKDEDEDKEGEFDVITEEDRQRKHIQKLYRDITARSAAIIVSQPFTVIAIRMMAQFVGGESKYNGFFSSIGEIFKESGIFGFFSGLIPRLLGEVTALIISSTLTYSINYFLIDERETRGYVATTMTSHLFPQQTTDHERCVAKISPYMASSQFGLFIASTLTYPFQIVSTCMAVSGSGLMAGQPPHMPVFTSWRDCWSYLYSINQMKRGSSLVCRYHNGPPVVINGKQIGVRRDQFL